MSALLDRVEAARARLPPAAGLALRLLWYLGLALLVTWPVALDPRSTLLGHAQASAPCHVWVLWWARHHLADIETDLIFHPYGADVVTLYGSDVLSPLLLRWFDAQPTLLYNGWAWALFVLGGLGTDRAARRLGATPGGGLLAGTIFATAPFLQHEALNGTSEIVAAAALPWFLHALLDVLDARDDGRWLRPRLHTVGRGLWLGLSYGLAVAASAYNLFFGLLLAGVVTIARLAIRAEPVFSRPVVQALAGAGLGVLPVGAFLAWLQLTHGASEVYTRRENWTSAELAGPDSFASLEMWLDRGAAVIPAIKLLPGGEVFEYWTTCTVYLGYAAVGLAAVGWWRGRARAPTGTLAALGLVAALVASGPYLRWEGEVLTWSGHAVPLPALLVADVFPPFVITAVHAYRYAVVVVLAVALLAGLAVRRAALAPPLALLVILDAVVGSPVPWPAATTEVRGSPALQALSEAPPGAVLHVPIEGEHLGDLGALLLAQTFHGKPVQDGGIHRRAGEEATTLFRDVLLVADLAARGEPRLPGPRATRYRLGQLREHGYRYVLHRRAEGQEELQAWLDRSLGRPAVDDGSWAWWEIEDEDVARREPGEPEDVAAP